MQRRGTYINPWPLIVIVTLVTIMYIAFCVIAFPVLGYGTFFMHWQDDFNWLLGNNVALIKVSAVFLGGWLIINSPFFCFIPIRHRAYKLLRGADYIQDTKQSLAYARAINKSAKGNYIHPELRLTSNENGLLATGGRGSGKTQLFMRMLTYLLNNPPKTKRQRRIIIYDRKGDYTKTLPTDDFILIAPWHNHGWAWDINDDVTNLTEARQMAHYFIKDGKGESIWPKGARQLFAAMLNYLIQEKEPITFTRLVQLTNASDEAFLKIVTAGLPSEVRRTLGQLSPEGHFNRTAQSFLANMSADMSSVTDLAFAWQNAKKHFSIKQFLADDWDGPEVMIIQGSAEHHDLSHALSATLISFLSNRICSGAFPEASDRDYSYDLYFYLDEVTRMKRVPEIEDLISEGRSKGVRPFIGLQDIGQVVELYGEAIAKTWASQFGAYFIGRTGPGETANWLSKQVIGTQEIEYMGSSVSFGGNNATSSSTLQRKEQPVVMPLEFSTDLFVDEQGKSFYGLVYITGHNAVMRLAWPIIKYTMVRPSMILNEDLNRSNFRVLLDGTPAATVSEAALPL